MATTYGEAVEALYRGPLGAFVEERKRLTKELKAGADKEGAARLAKLGRPSISAWAVNQLWWKEREAFEHLLATAERVRAGAHDAATAHQRALAALRALAAAELVRAGHGAAEATLRRVTMTLAALAAAGGFAPDLAGALATDRDPPGFDAFGSGAASADPPMAPDGGLAVPREASAARGATSGEREAPGVEEAREREREERERATQERERIEEEQRRLAEARARRRAERERIEAKLAAARAAVEEQSRDAARLRLAIERLRRELDATGEELGRAEEKLEAARTSVAELEAALAENERDG